MCRDGSRAAVEEGKVVKGLGEKGGTTVVQEVVASLVTKGNEAMVVPTIMEAVVEEEEERAGSAQEVRAV